jgi:hypothetical protein
MKSQQQMKNIFSKKHYFVVTENVCGSLDVSEDDKNIILNITYSYCF